MQGLTAAAEVKDEPLEKDAKEKRVLAKKIKAEADVAEAEAVRAEAIALAKRAVAKQAKQAKQDAKENSTEAQNKKVEGLRKEADEADAEARTKRTAAQAKKREADRAESNARKAEVRVNKPKVNPRNVDVKVEAVAEHKEVEGLREWSYKSLLQSTQNCKPLQAPPGPHDLFWCGVSLANPDFQGQNVHKVMRLFLDSRFNEASFYIPDELQMVNLLVEEGNDIARALSRARILGRAFVGEALSCLEKESSKVAVFICDASFNNIRQIDLSKKTPLGEGHHPYYKRTEFHRDSADYLKAMEQARIEGKKIISFVAAGVACNQDDSKNKAIKDVIKEVLDKHIEDFKTAFKTKVEAMLKKIQQQSGDDKLKTEAFFGKKIDKITLSDVYEVILKYVKQELLDLALLNDFATDRSRQIKQVGKIQDKIFTFFAYTIGRSFKGFSFLIGMVGKINEEFNRLGIDKKINGGLYAEELRYLDISSSLRDDKAEPSASKEKVKIKPEDLLGEWKFKPSEIKEEDVASPAGNGTPLLTATGLSPAPKKNQTPLLTPTVPPPVPNPTPRSASAAFPYHVLMEGSEDHRWVPLPTSTARDATAAAARPNATPKAKEGMAQRVGHFSPFMSSGPDSKLADTTRSPVKADISFSPLPAASVPATAAATAVPAPPLLRP